MGVSMPYSLTLRISNVETYLRKKFYETCHKKFSSPVFHLLQNQV